MFKALDYGTSKQTLYPKLCLAYYTQMVGWGEERTPTKRLMAQYDYGFDTRYERMKLIWFVKWYEWKTDWSFKILTNVGVRSSPQPTSDVEWRE